MKTTELTAGCPKFLKDWLNSLFADVQANEPVQGAGISITRDDSGSVIALSASSGTGGTGDITPCLVAAGPPPGSGTFILGAIDGVCQWIDTTTCS